MMTHSQLKQFITEAILLLVIGIGIVAGGYFLSNDNANRRVQSEYKSLQTINAGEGMEKREPSYTVGGNAN